MIRCVFAIPGDLATPTGGYAYARKILPLLSERFETKVCNLPGSYPFPAATDYDTTIFTLKEHDAPGSVFLIDGLAFGAMPTGIIQQIQSPIVALVHHPLGLEEGLTPSQKQALLASEDAVLGFARHIIVPSPATGRALTELFGVDAARITVAQPGVAKRRRASGSRPGEPLHILSVGAITPRKGFDVFVNALKLIEGMPWRAIIAGSLDRAPATTAELRALIAAFCLNDRVQLVGVLDENQLAALYEAADVFALATFYEGYGMVFAEAMAHGLPVVASGEGAVKDTVPEAAGFYCRAGNPSAFAEALRQMLVDAATRAEKADGAWRHAQGLPSWSDTAAIIADVLRRAAAT